MQGLRVYTKSPSVPCIWFDGLAFNNILVFSFFAKKRCWSKHTTHTQKVYSIKNVMCENVQPLQYIPNAVESARIAARLQIKRSPLRRMRYNAEVINSWSWLMCDHYLTTSLNNTRTQKIIYAPMLCSFLSFHKRRYQRSSSWREAIEFKRKKSNQTLPNCSKGLGRCFRKRLWIWSYGGRLGARRHRWHWSSKASENVRIQVPPDAAHCSNLKCLWALV